MKCCIIIKDGNSRLSVGEDGLQRTRMDYFGNLYNMSTEEQVAVHMYDFDGVQ